MRSSARAVGGHEPLLDVPEGRAHRLGAAQRPHRLQDQGLGRAGRLRHVGGRVASLHEGGRDGLVDQGLDQALAEVARAGYRGRGFLLWPGSDADLDEDALQPEAGGLVRARQRTAGRRRRGGHRAEADDLSVAQQHAERRLVGAERQHAAAALPVEMRQEREGLRRDGVGVHGSVTGRESER